MTYLKNLFQDKKDWKMKLKLGGVSLVIALVLAAFVNWTCATAPEPKVVEASHQDDACVDPPHDMEGREMYICQGSVYGKICCAYGPDEASGCLAVLCRASCGADWEFQGAHCPQ